jgi:hypothetical protein
LREAYEKFAYLEGRIKGIADILSKGGSPELAVNRLRRLEGLLEAYTQEHNTGAKSDL